MTIEIEDSARFQMKIKKKPQLPNQALERALPKPVKSTVLAIRDVIALAGKDRLLGRDSREEGMR